MAEGPSSSTSGGKKTPICLIVLGMAGSGKTSLVERLSNPFMLNRPYVINLDPACLQVPYFANIDIRDTVNYKDVMKQYKLGPNGAIVTCLNLFSTKFPDVIEYIEKCNSQYCIIDTPGQIEVFTWSISGSIITEALASTFPTVILYVIDCIKSTSPVTFMSNMLYACSILYKTRLPFVVLLNKTDIVHHGYALDWIQDSEVFYEALQETDHYMNNLSRSLALALDDFYFNLKVCGVSAGTGEGFDKLFRLIDKAVVEYENDYRVEWEKLRAEAAKKRAEPKASTSKGKSLATDAGVSHELSDIYLRHPGNESSSDSEGEEAEPETNDDGDEAETFRKVLQQQRELQIKRAKEAEEKQQSKTEE